MKPELQADHCWTTWLKYGTIASYWEIVQEKAPSWKNKIAYLASTLRDWGNNISSSHSSVVCTDTAFSTYGISRDVEG